MKLLLRAAVLFVCAAAAGCALLFGRNGMDSARPAGPVRVDARDNEWTNVTPYEDEGLSVQAMNDDANLYLLLSASSREGRSQLNGKAREAVALWFVAPDGKTRTWGILLPFNEHWMSDGDQGPDPEYVEAGGAKVSTGPWPSDVEFRTDISDRRPVYEARVPLARVSRMKDGRIPFDFAITGTAASSGRRTGRVAGGGEGGGEGSQPDRWSSPEAGGTAGRGGAGGGRGGGGKGRKGESVAPADETPEPLELKLLLRPAPAPGADR